MKIKFLLPILIAAAGCRGTYEERESTAASPGAEATPLGSYATPAPGAAGESMVVEVVSVDAAKANVTLRDPAAAAGTGERTLTVEATATSELGSLKPGDRVRVSCRRFQGTIEGTPPGAGTTTTMGGLNDCTAVVTITKETSAATR